MEYIFSGHCWYYRQSVTMMNLIHVYQKMVNNLIQISKSILFLVLLAFGYVVKRKPGMLDLAIGKKKVTECMRFFCVG